MNYNFIKTDDGVITDKDVVKAVSKLDKVTSKTSVTIEAGYADTHEAYCKITGLKEPIVTAGKKVGQAVNDAVKKVSRIIRNDKKTIIDKKEHARKKANKKEEGED
jgi:hypothetical protein